MAVMCGVVGALAAFYHDGLDIFDPQHRMIASHRLIAKMPTIAAMAYKYSLGQPFVYPRNDFGYAENLLHMLFSVPCEPYRASAAAVRALDGVLISGFYVVPLFHTPDQWIARWTYIERPAKTSLSGYLPEPWWHQPPHQ